MPAEFAMIMTIRLHKGQKQVNPAASADPLLSAVGAAGPAACRGGRSPRCARRGALDPVRPR